MPSALFYFHLSTSNYSVISHKLFYHAVVYALAHYARYDMKQQPHLADKLKGEGINGEGGETSTSEERVALEQRLAAVESTLQALQKTLETKPTTQNIAAIASAGKSTGKEATSERSKAPT